MACEVSIIIPSRNEFKNLIWTLQGLQLELQDVDYEIIVVLNQCEEKEQERLLKYWPVSTGRLKVLAYDEKPSCWQARNFGASQARGDYLLFCDSHVLLTPGSLRGALKYHREFKGILHFGINYWLDHPERTLFQYKWQPQKFWGAWTRIKPEPPDYRILMSGLAGTMIDRSIFQELGGFHPALGIYGGGEPYLDLKTQMHGYQVRCHPDYQLYHLAERRGYCWNNDDLWRNFMIASYALGGNEYLKPVYDHYHDVCNGHQKYIDRLNELQDEAIELVGHPIEAKLTLDEVLHDYF